MGNADRRAALSLFSSLAFFGSTKNAFAAEVLPQTKLFENYYFGQSFEEVQGVATAAPHPDVANVLKGREQLFNREVSVVFIFVRNKLDRLHMTFADYQSTMDTFHEVMNKLSQNGFTAIEISQFDRSRPMDPPKRLIDVRAGQDINGKNELILAAVAAKDSVSVRMVTTASLSQDKISRTSKAFYDRMGPEFRIVRLIFTEEAPELNVIFASPGCSRISTAAYNNSRM